MVDDFLTCLDRFKPLWEFLTAVGTVLAVVISLWLATRKQRAHITVSAESKGDQYSLTATNDGDAGIIVMRCEWGADCISGSGRVHLPSYPFNLNNHVAQSIPQRITKGDILNTWGSLKQIAEAANQQIPNTVAMSQVEASVRNSRFACVTTTEGAFTTALPAATQEELIRHFRLLRTPI